MLNLHREVLQEFVEAARQGRRGGSSGVRLLVGGGDVDTTAADARCRAGRDLKAAEALSVEDFDRMAAEARKHFAARLAIEAEFRKARAGSSQRCAHCGRGYWGRGKFCGRRCSEHARVVVMGRWPSRARNNGRGPGRPSTTVGFAGRVREWLSAAPDASTSALVGRAQGEGYSGSISAFYKLVASVRAERQAA